MTADSTVLRMPAPSTATTVTRVSPIISAAAVEAVRLGLRTEFALASSPATPPLRRAGKPTRRVSGLTMCGAAKATPTKSAQDPDAEQQDDRQRCRARSRRSPTQMAATDAAITATAVLSEWAAKREGGSVEPSRTAAIGGTRVARRAGTMLASTVITVPSASETRTVRSANTIPASGRSPPIAVSSLASPNPANSPITEASSPITRPSITTERMTCLREAPSVRSVANSRVRWATVIDRVLKITNAPTNSAIAPKPSRK